MPNELRIVFMGTPDFAVGILSEMINAGKNVVGVITAPDKPAGRGRKLMASAVKEFAVSQNLKVLQPANLKDEVFFKGVEGLKRQSASGRCFSDASESCLANA